MNDAGPGGNEEIAMSELIKKAGPRAEPSKQRTERVRAAVHKHWQAGGEAARPAAPWGWIAGVAAALVLTVGVFTQRVTTTPGHHSVAEILSQLGDVRIADSQGLIAPGTEIATGADGMINLRLTSGHELRLQQDTRVVLVAATQVSLAHGTVYLDSGVGGAHASMQVITPFGNARDIGTQFEVSVDARSIEVIVREGLVALEALPALADSFDATLERGSGVRIDSAGETTEFSVSSWDERWNWTSTMSGFGKVAAPGREYVDWLVREYGLTLRLEGAGVAQRLEQEVTGVTPDAITDLDAELADPLLALQLQHRFEDGGVLVIFALSQP